LISKLKQQVYYQLKREKYKKHCTQDS